jgi:Protein of unknown function (DUF938)
MNDARRYAPAALRNRDLILNVLRAHLPASGLVLEIASGSGEHCIRFAEALPRLIFQPSDPSQEARASIDAWGAASGLDNIRPALDLDAAAESWPIAKADAILCINMIHIAPWRAAQGLFRHATRRLNDDQILYLYGPFNRGGRYTSAGNANFDASLKQENAEWGLRDLESVTALGSETGFDAPEVIDMPANNLSLVFRKAR